MAERVIFFESPPRTIFSRTASNSNRYHKFGCQRMSGLEQPAGAPLELSLGRCRVPRPAHQTLNGSLGCADAAALAAPQSLCILDQPDQVRRGASVSDMF